GLMAGGKAHILISSAGRRVALLRAFQAAVAPAGRVYACDVNALSAAVQLADGGFDVPRCTAPSFIPRIIEICSQAGIGCIVPTIDPELSVYAKHADTLRSQNVTVLVSSESCVEIGVDKAKTNKWLTAEGFPTV